MLVCRAKRLFSVHEGRQVGLKLVARGQAASARRSSVFTRPNLGFQAAASRLDDKWYLLGFYLRNNLAFSFHPTHLDSSSALSSGVKGRTRARGNRRYAPQSSRHFRPSV